MTTHPHPPDDLTNGRFVTYQVKFEGIYTVGEASGPSPVQSAFIDMKRAKDDRRKKGQKKAPVMEMRISVDFVKIINPDTDTAEVDTTLNKISFIMNDRNNKLYAAFIIKADNESYQCAIIKSDHGKAKQIVMTLAEAFDIAFQRKVESKTNSSVDAKQVSVGGGVVVPESSSVSARAPLPDSSVDQLKEENIVLKERLLELSNLMDQTVVDVFMQEKRIRSITEVKLVPGKRLSAPLFETMEPPTPPARKTAPSAAGRLEDSIPDWTNNPFGSPPIALDPPPPPGRLKSRSNSRSAANTTNPFTATNQPPTSQNNNGDPFDMMFGRADTSGWIQPSIDEFDLDIFDPLKTK